MSAQTENAQMTRNAGFDPAIVNVRIKISALWTAMLFVFAYVDIFSLYRSDFRADIEAGRIAGFTIDQAFLLATTAYVAIPSLMVFAALVLRPKLNRFANIALSIGYALTIIVGAIGTWNYYILGSAVEVTLLGSIVYCAWTWPRLVPAASTSELDAPPQQVLPTAAETV